MTSSGTAPAAQRYRTAVDRAQHFHHRVGCRVARFLVDVGHLGPRHMAACRGWRRPHVSFVERPGDLFVDAAVDEVEGDRLGQDRKRRQCWQIDATGSWRGRHRGIEEAGEPTVGLGTDHDRRRCREAVAHEQPARPRQRFVLEGDHDQRRGPRHEQVLEFVDHAGGRVRRGPGRDTSPRRRGQRGMLHAHGVEPTGGDPVDQRHAQGSPSFIGVCAAAATMTLRPELPRPNTTRCGTSDVSGGKCSSSSAPAALA